MHSSNSIQNYFLSLIRFSIHKKIDKNFHEKHVDWELLLSLSKQHGLVGLILEGIICMKMGDNKDYSSCPIDTLTLTKWYGLAMKYKTAREANTAVIANLCAFYREHGIDMMLLKGYALSLYWPHPETRPSGDVDIYLFDEQGPAWHRGDKLVAEKLGKIVTVDIEHHTKFDINGICVENHYDFVNTKIRKSSARIENVFKSLAQDHSNYIIVSEQKVYVPSDKLNSLFLLRHLSIHFACEGLNFRQVLDWAFFASKTAIDWQWLYEVAKDYNMHRFLSCLNAICVEDFGFEDDKLPVYHPDKTLKDRIFQEIFTPLDIISNATVLNRTKRWWNHRWKHRICFSDSMISSFFTSVTANLFDKTIKS